MTEKQKKDAKEIVDLYKAFHDALSGPKVPWYKDPDMQIATFLLLVLVGIFYAVSRL